MSRDDRLEDPRRAAAAPRSGGARRAPAGKRIVFANGAFDLLHVGHVRYLEAARREGDWLAVGVNSDRSVARAKGPSRPDPSARPSAPRSSRRSRAWTPSTIFDEDSPAELIAALRPDVHAKGTDYAAETVPERAVVAAYGGRTVIVGDPKDHATTDVDRANPRDGRAAPACSS